MLRLAYRLPEVQASVESLGPSAPSLPAWSAESVQRSLLQSALVHCLGLVDFLLDFHLLATTVGPAELGYI